MTTFNIADFNQDTIIKLQTWVYEQFTPNHKPSKRTINDFIKWFIKDHVRNYDMPLDTSYHEILNNWNIEEPFNEYFLD